MTRETLAEWGMCSIGCGSNPVFNLSNHFQLVLSDNDSEQNLISTPDGQGKHLTYGRRIEAQFQRGDQFLLLLTEDSPYEECLHILLLTAGNVALDEVLLGAPYTPGIVLNISPTESGCRFCMYDSDWQVTAHQSSKFWPAYGLPTGASRRLSRWLSGRHLQIERLSDST